MPTMGLTSTTGYSVTTNYCRHDYRPCSKDTVASSREIRSVRRCTKCFDLEVEYVPEKQVHKTIERERVTVLKRTPLNLKPRGNQFIRPPRVLR